MISTLVRNAVSNTTYPLRHQFARTVPDVRGSDADLTSYGDADAHILVTGLAARQFNRMRDNFNIADLVGRVVPVRPSRPDGEQWYLNEDDNPSLSGGAYLAGARINPTPVNGRLYQELRGVGPGSDVQTSPFTLRYNDEFHIPARAERDNPWTIVWAVDGLAHQVGRARVTPPIAWVEVTDPLSPVATGLATDEDIELILSDVDSTAAIVAGFTGNAVTDHTMGKAHVETEGEHAGHVLLDPPVVEGEVYLTWYPDREYYVDHVFVQVGRAEPTDGQLFTAFGYFNRGVNGQVYYTDDMYATAPMPRLGRDTTMHWAKLGFETPAPSDLSETRRTALIEQMTASHEAFENLNDALNELARHQSWCSEYERTMQWIGMRDRRSGNRQPFDLDNVGTLAAVERHAWDVQYDVDVTIRDDSASYRVTNMLESEYGASSVSDLRFDATITVTINGVVAEDEDSAENMVTRSQIEDELDSIIDGEFEINDYTHSDTNEDTDFDWDEYDDNL